MKVPEMGDSIREGTIVEWAVKTGQAVKTDDVVAMVETDKVTVEIRAEIDGVLTEKFAEVDETVDVGGDLYEIDTEGEASTAVASREDLSKDTIASSDELDENLIAEPAQTAKEESSNSGHRSPSIQFLGKEGWARVLSGEPLKEPQQLATVQVLVLDPMYGRPKFTEEEIEALILGGASIAPEVVSHSTGAKFRL
jgi:pyruvate/2-oxoglutarate dehydrogenase complex dihydrolipoamide acyltransferase (E2) component